MPCPSGRSSMTRFGYWPGSTFVAALPVLVLLGLLLSERVNAWQAALAGLMTAGVVAVAAFGMPADLVLASAAVGIGFALFRIVWLIVAAVFLYDIAVATGQFDVMKASIARLSGDRRLQAVLVAFSFGAFIEGAAGFGAPVAISAAFLVGLGFEPFQAALLCLIANTAPVAWGAIGTPIRTLSTVTGLDVEALERHLGSDLALPLAHHPVLARPDHGRLARDLGRLAGLADDRGYLRRCSVPLVKLRRVRARRPDVRCRQPARGHDRAPALETQERVAIRLRSRSPSRSRPQGKHRGRARLDPRPRRPRLDAVRPPDAHGPGLGNARRQSRSGPPPSRRGWMPTPPGS